MSQKLPKNADCESIMSSTTRASSLTKGSKAPSAPIDNALASGEKGPSAPPSVVGGGSRCSNGSKATTTVTVALRRQIEQLEEQLVIERKERTEAAKKIEDTQKELDALEKLMRLKS